MPALITWLLLTALLMGCKQKIDAAGSGRAGTESVPMPALVPEPGYDTVTAPSLDSICIFAQRVVRCKDSIENAIGARDLRDAKDSAALAPLLRIGYGYLLAYRRLLAAGAPLSKADPAPPSLIGPDSITDSMSLRTLPRIEASDYLAEGKFYFFGGGPFLSRKTDEKGDAYSDPAGKPEARFTCSINGNTWGFLATVRSVRAVRIQVGFGPPLGSYESGPQEIHGVGSLGHVFVERIPAYFLTAEGPIPAQVVSVRHKLVPENLGCTPDSPEVEFASAGIPKGDILGVYIPLGSEAPPACNVMRKENLWTADLNGDGVPEFAGVTDSFTGISDDTLWRAFWFANIRGGWRRIDSAENLDCT